MPFGHGSIQRQRCIVTMDGWTMDCAETSTSEHIGLIIGLNVTFNWKMGEIFHKSKCSFILLAFTHFPFDPQNNRSNCDTLMLYTQTQICQKKPLESEKPQPKPSLTFVANNSHIHTEADFKQPNQKIFDARAFVCHQLAALS